MAPVINRLFLVSTILFLAACGSKSSDNDGGEKGQAPIIVDGKLHLKSPGLKKVMIGHTVDVSKLLDNSAGADYEVVEGMQSVQWIPGSQPKLHFIQGGKVTVLVTDAKNETSIAIKFQVVFDTTELTGGFEGPELGLPDNSVLHL